MDKLMAPMYESRSQGLINHQAGSVSNPFYNYFLRYILFVYTFVKTRTMKTLSLKLDDPVFAETEKIIGKLRKTRNRYINEALGFYNLLHKKRLLARQLQTESKLVRAESLKVLAEFEKFQDED